MDVIRTCGPGGNVAVGITVGSGVAVGGIVAVGAEVAVGSRVATISIVGVAVGSGELTALMPKNAIAATKKKPRAPIPIHFMGKPPPPFEDLALGAGGLAGGGGGLAFTG